MAKKKAAKKKASGSSGADLRQLAEVVFAEEIEALIKAEHREEGQAGP